MTAERSDMVCKVTYMQMRNSTYVHAYVRTYRYFLTAARYYVQYGQQEAIVDSRVDYATYSSQIPCFSLDNHPHNHKYRTVLYVQYCTNWRHNKEPRKQKVQSISTATVHLPPTTTCPKSAEPKRNPTTTPRTVFPRQQYQTLSPNMLQEAVHLA